MYVTTYQHAYVSGTTTLCDAHAKTRPAWVPVLGAVSHGRHEGRCSACDAEISDEQIRQLSTEAAEAGDLAQVRVCERAMTGDERARLACAAIIRDAEAQRGEG